MATEIEARTFGCKQVDERQDADRAQEGKRKEASEGSVSQSCQTSCQSGTS